MECSILSEITMILMIFLKNYKKSYIFIKLSKYWNNHQKYIKIFILYRINHKLIQKYIKNKDKWMVKI